MLCHCERAIVFNSAIRGNVEGVKRTSNLGITQIVNNFILDWGTRYFTCISVLFSVVTVNCNNPPSVKLKRTRWNNAIFHQFQSDLCAFEWLQVVTYNCTTLVDLFSLLRVHNYVRLYFSKTLLNLKFEKSCFVWNKSRQRQPDRSLINFDV